MLFDTPAFLRELADSIEQGKVGIMRAVWETKAEHGRFVVGELTLGVAAVEQKGGELPQP